MRAILMSCVQYEDEIKSGKASVLDVAPVAKRLGLAGVEYREVYWHDKTRELPAVRAQLAELGLQGTYATFSTLYNPDIEGRARLIEDLADARNLGSSLLRVFRGALPGVEDPAIRDGARTAIARAADLGIILVVENFVRAPGNRIADIVQVMESFETPAVGTNLDVSNYVLNDQDPIEAIRALGPRIRYTHLKDVKDTPEGKRSTVLGKGSLPYRDILTALDAAGPDFPLCFEFGGEGNPEDSLRQGIAYLASL